MLSTSNGKDKHVGDTTTQSAAVADKFLDESLLDPRLQMSGVM